MGLLNYTEICSLIEQGVINSPIEHVNGVSLDLVLDKTILIESNLGINENIDLINGEAPCFHSYTMDDEGYELTPSEFILASTVDCFDLPNNITAFYCLKSSLARSGLEHLNSGLVDPFFKGNLTLELKNILRYNSLTIKPCMKIGQVTFMRHNAVPYQHGYAKKGQYMLQSGVTGSNGVK